MGDDAEVANVRVFSRHDQGARRKKRACVTRNRAKIYADAFAR
ncbi:hypothetical protein A176_003406 [Myxococcus hansupus]|uniref:Uncharacterized protein n=1 Tax=Pseudomyxococcus hansupus TaxID=1297742 RepID=A0A0H4WUN4_9BACT|nr:hypothetical protein A176_003406 [Myxococcus hansupus]